MKTKKVFLGLLALASVGMLFITGCGKKNDTKTTKDSKTTKQVTTKQGGSTTKKNSTTQGGGIKAFVITFAAEGQQSIIDNAFGEYTLPASSFEEPAGKVFKCWDVDGVEKHPGDKINVTDNIVITAVFRDKDQTDEEKEIYNKLVNLVDEYENYNGTYSGVYTYYYNDTEEEEEETKYFGEDYDTKRGYLIYENGDFDGRKYKYFPKIRDGIDIKDAFIKYSYSGMDSNYVGVDVVDYNYYLNPGRDIKKEFSNYANILDVYLVNKELVTRYINYMTSTGEMAEMASAYGYVAGPSNFTYEYTTTTDGKYKALINMSVLYVVPVDETTYINSIAKMEFIFDDDYIYKVTLNETQKMANAGVEVLAGEREKTWDLTYTFDETKYNSITTDQDEVVKADSISASNHPLIYNGYQIGYIQFGYTYETSASYIDDLLHNNQFKNMPHIHITSLALKEDLSDAVTGSTKIAMPLEDEPVYCTVSIDSGYALVAVEFGQIRDLQPAAYELFTIEELDMLGVLPSTMKSHYVVEITRSSSTPIPLEDSSIVGTKLVVKKDGVAYKDSTFNSASKDFYAFSIESRKIDGEYGTEKRPCTINCAESVLPNKILFGVSGLGTEIKNFVVDRNKITKDVKLVNSTEYVAAGSDLISTKTTDVDTTLYAFSYKIKNGSNWKAVDSLSDIPSTYTDEVLICVKMKNSSDTLGLYSYLVVE